METIRVNRCVHCMADLTGVEGGSYCPRCGSLTRQVEQPAYCLRPFSILHGKYLVGRMLGQGGFGITYVGLDLALESKVAIKECYPGSMASRNNSVSNQLAWTGGMDRETLGRASCESFLREARKMAKMQDIPAVVRVRDTFEENNTAYIVMDFVEGITLKQWIEQNGTLPPRKCVELLRPMISALESVHRQGFVHRDISPDNIMLQSDGGMKLLDLGAAKDMERSGGGHSQLVAKNGFSPVEQYAETGDIGPWTDVYAMCATMYYCMTGKTVTPALDRLDGGQTLEFDPKSFREPLPAAVASTLQDGLALDHKKRIQSMTELLKRLDGVQPPKPLPAARIALAGAAALLLVTAGALLFRHFNKTAGDPVESPGGIIETDTGGEDEPEGLHVVTLGTPNPNLLNYGGYAKIAQEYQYFIGGDNALYVCAYNKEDSTFYMGDAGKVYDMAGYITLGDGCVYFGSTIGAVHSLCRMDPDGGNIETIYSTSADSRGLNDLQYVKYSDGREYLYYSYENEEDGSLFSLYRYDLSAGETEVVVESDLYWFNLYHDSIYYTEQTDSGTRLVRADLDGQNGEELNSDALLTIGFVADDTVFLWSYRDEALLAFDLDGTLRSDVSGFYDIEMDLDHFDISYGGGWLYYVAADGNIHRIRANGTGDTVAMEGHKSIVMCVDQDSWVWFIENLPAGREHRYTQQAFISYRDGSTLFEIGEAKGSWNLSDAYRGDLEYSRDAAEEKGYEGVFITGYTGVYTSIELPDEIDGLPVTGIAAEAFSESGIEEIGLPEGLRYIGEDAFYRCYDLTFVGLPDSLEVIDEAAFGSCSGLTSVEFPDGLKNIESLAFADTMLSEVRLPASVEWVGGGAFAVRAAAGLTEFRVDAGNKNIRSVDGVLYAYQDNYPLLMLISCPSGRGGSYEIPDGTRAVQNFAFAHCKQLTDVTVPETVLIIYANSFYDTGVTAIKVNSDCDLRGTWDGSIAVAYY